MVQIASKAAGVAATPGSRPPGNTTAALATSRNTSPGMTTETKVEGMSLGPKGPGNGVRATARATVNKVAKRQRIAAE